MCREEAQALKDVFQEAASERNALQNLFGAPRLVAVVKDSLNNDDGTNEVDAFREYFDGEVFVDSDLSMYKALGDRQFTDGAFSKESSEFFEQRTEGIKRKGVDGNMRGSPENSLLAGGSMVVSREGKVLFSHQEGVGAIDYDAVRTALQEL